MYQVRQEPVKALTTQRLVSSPPGLHMRWIAGAFPLDTRNALDYTEDDAI